MTKTKWLGIDFSGSHRQWGPAVINSNIWLASLQDGDRGPDLADLRRVQSLPGNGPPFDRLVERLARRDFLGAGIDAPFSIPDRYIPNHRHSDLLSLVAGLPATSRPFPYGRDLLQTVSPGLVVGKPYRETEKGHHVNVRSTLWNGPRGGAPMTVACLTLIAKCGNPIWPWDSGEEGLLIEAFPAAQLRHWNSCFQGYSGTTKGAIEARRVIIKALATRIELGVYVPTLESSPDALDAVVAAFAAVAVTEDKLLSPPPLEGGAEGWIALHR